MKYLMNVKFDFKIILQLVVFCEDTKKGQAIYIAPLQPDTVASIKTWRSSRGAGRVGLTRVQR